MLLGAISASIAAHTARGSSGHRPPRVAVDEGFEVVGVGAFEGLEVGQGVAEGDLVELRGPGRRQSNRRSAGHPPSACSLPL